MEEARVVVFDDANEVGDSCVCNAVSTLIC